MDEILIVSALGITSAIISVMATVWAVFAKAKEAHLRKVFTEILHGRVEESSSQQGVCS